MLAVVLATVVMYVVFLARVTLDELRQCLRLAGITRLADVAWVVLEAHGQISVARQSSTPDPFLADDVPGYADQRCP